MEPNSIQSENKLLENVDFLHYTNDLNAEKMNVAEEFKLKIVIKV